MSDKEKPIAKECKFAIHIQTRSSDIPDYHLVKETLHFADGTTKPNVRFVKDYLRPFWVTSPHKRDHVQKKESEAVDNLVAYKCTQSDLRMKVSYALGKGGYGRDIKELSESPYLYGTDISSTVLIKHDYSLKWPETSSPYTTMPLDSETDVVRGTDDTIIVTTISNNVLYTLVLDWFVDGYDDPEKHYRNAVAKHLQEDLDELGITSVFKIFKTPAEIIDYAFKIAHKDLPDFVAIWNIDYDIPRFLNQLKKYKVDPKDVFSDPKLPPELRFCKYKEGSRKKRTASGAIKPKKPSEQWHSLHTPAGFYVIDAMCTYRFLRLGDQELKDYGLDAVLSLNLGERKMKFSFADGYSGLEWHKFMQENYPFEYMCYAGADVTRMLKLERKTGDLATNISTNSGYSDFADFSLSTKRFSDDFGLWLMDTQNRVPGTVPPMEKNDVDETPLVGGDDDDEEDDDSEFEEEKEEEVDYDSYNSVTGLRGWINVSYTVPSQRDLCRKRYLIDGNPLRDTDTKFVMATHGWPA